MAKPIKLTVIGAGSAVFSLGLVRDICLTPNLADSSVAFMDIDEDRLDMIHKLAERYAEELGVRMTFEKTTDRREALQDADFVINTAMVGGHDHLEEVRQMAKRYGFPGAVGGGSYHQFKFMMEVAHDIEEICPNAWLIQSGNPVFSGTTLMTRHTGVKVIGLCHGHYGYRRVAELLGVDPDQVTWVAPGLNHLIWLTEFRHQGKDLYPMVDEWIANKSEEYWKDREANPDKYGVEDYMSRAVVDQYRRFGLLPVGDTTRGGGWWYKTDLETRKYWYGPYGGFGSDLETPPRLARKKRQIARIADVAADTSTSVLEAFPPNRTREQQIPIIDALTNDVAGQFQINVPNKGVLPGVADDVVTEMPAIIDKGGIHCIQMQPLPKKTMLEVIQPSILSMEWGLEAYLTGDRRMLLDGALMLSTYQSSGLTKSYQQVVDFMEEYFSLPSTKKWPSISSNTRFSLE